ncbi:MAG TPA: hypothetical protein VFR85_14065 [Anaeromyxobacteraceae bacterium]|nr:hypothetical protein [Anaeromyxobacteraceae bacterium]
MGLADSSLAVLAGSPAFLNAVLPPLAAALGVRPRVADAPHQVFALCQDGARLLVCEYRGLEWLPLVEDLKTTFGDELQVVVAVPGEHGRSSGPLFGAGADEVLPWDGRPGALVSTAVRLAGVPAAQASGPAGAPARTPPAPAQPAVAPARPAPAMTPARAVPAAAPPVAAAVNPTPAVTPRPPPPPTPPRAAPAATPGRPAPAVTPARPIPAVTPAAVAPVKPAPAVTPRPLTATTPPRAVPPVSPARPVAAVAPAVAPASRGPAAAPSPTPDREPPPVAAVAGGAALAPAPGYFADLKSDESASVAAPRDAAATWGHAELVAFERSEAWPGTLLASRDAEGILAGAVAGYWPEKADLKAHTERAVAELSPLERDAVGGRPVPADPASVCRAAALRWQVSAALATAPPPGSPVDAAAVRAILAEIDVVLAQLKAASQGAPAGALAALDQLRGSLVAKAVDLTETVQRIAPQEAPPAEAARPAPRAATRLLSNRGEAAGTTAPPRRQGYLWAALAVALLGAVAYHGYRYTHRRSAPQAPMVPGAPPGAVAGPELPGGGRVVILPPGAADPHAIERFRAEQEAKGRTVQGDAAVIVVTPRAAQQDKRGTEGSP